MKTVAEFLAEWKVFGDDKEFASALEAFHAEAQNHISQLELELATAQRKDVPASELSSIQSTLRVVRAENDDLRNKLQKSWKHSGELSERIAQKEGSK